MKKIFAYIAASIVAASASAEVLTPAMALERVSAMQTPAARKIKSRAGLSTDMEPAMTISHAGRNQLYMFTPDNGGLILVSAESETPALIGYSDNYVDGTELPPALLAMIDFYASEIEDLRNGNVIRTAAEVRAAESRPAIPVICSTRWNQDAPYNQLCPMLQGYRSMTGCVATAMAQVLKVYAYPATCNGGNYSYYWDNGGQNLSLFFNTVSLNWDKMLDTYSSSSPEDAKTAVATIMRAIGYASNMNYSPKASGAVGYNTAQGLVRNFDYDPTLGYLSRDWFSTVDWENMIYDVLAEGYPIYYDGVTANNEGHAFVIDGYNGDALFHVNWGWGGVSDGYFALTALDPGTQGIGGGSAGFNFYQGIIHGLKKGKTTSESMAPVRMFMYGGIKATTTSANLGRSITLTYTGQYAGIYNCSPYTVGDYTVAVQLTKSDGTVSYINTSTRVTNIKPLYGIDNNLAVTFPTSLADGDYRMTLASYNPATKSYTPIYYPVGTAGPVSVNVSNGFIHFSDYTPATVSASNLSVPAVIYTAKPFTLTGKITNESDEMYQGDITAALYAKGQTIKRAELGKLPLLSIEAGSSIDFEMSLQLSDITVNSGEYDLALTDANNNRISEPLTVTVEASGNTQIKASGLTVDNTAKNNLTFTVTISAVDADFNSPIYLQINNRGNYNSYVARFESEPINVKKGESKTVTVSGDFVDGVVNSNYTAYVYYVYNDAMTEASGRQRANFTLTEPDDSAIESIEAADNSGAPAEYFDLSGRRIAKPARKGIYIIRRGNQSQKVSL